MAGAAKAPSRLVRSGLAEPKALLSPAERLMAKARAFGAEDCCVRDPYMTVDEQKLELLEHVF